MQGQPLLFLAAAAVLLADLVLGMLISAFLLPACTLNEAHVRFR